MDIEHYVTGQQTVNTAFFDYLKGSENSLTTMKAAIILFAVLGLVAAFPEAPVDRRYLPPGNGVSQQYGPPSPRYGPPGYQSGGPIGPTEDPLAEPASYQFSYKVEDAEAGLDFGHQEQREGDDTKGEYRVLLPDGRTMIVTYTADQDGYKPEIRFEEARGGYPRGPQNGY